MAAESESKAQVAVATCSISSLFSACAHRGQSPRGPAFIDWYLVLRVDEEAGFENIRTQYRRLALQLHPDKNKHPKAEAAFKFVSEAYECLADEVKRKAFNSLREENFCSECYNKSLSKRDNNSEKQRTGVQTKLRRALMALKETKKRLQEECRVIETCLNTNRARAGNVSPLFDPSAHLLNNGYPHYRDRSFAAPDEHEQFRSSDDKNHRNKGRCESPIYEIRKEQKPNKPKNYGFRF